MGQCVGVIEAVAPFVGAVLKDRYAEQRISGDMLPDIDRRAWNHILSLRKRLVHQGPGFLDWVDMFSGRFWREYNVEIPLDQQAKEVWKLGRQLCRSNLILACPGLQGVSAEVFAGSLAQADLVMLTLREISALVEPEIEVFHARAAALRE